MQSPTWIRARHLDEWAESPQAKVLLPELIGRLVRATVPREHLIKCDFPAEAETHRSGYDGTTVTTQRTLYVPAGITYWELGCDAKPEQKAEKDYQKRVKDHEERVKAGEVDDISKATFVAVTARDWHSKNMARKKMGGKTHQRSSRTKAKASGGMVEWTETRNNDLYFREVCALDSSRLEQWISESPAVGLWLAKEMGKPVAGVMDIGSYWLDIQAALKRPLSPEVLLVNRASIAVGFQRWISGPQNELSIRAPSAIEVIAVFAAWIHTLPKGEGDAISSRAIIVENRDTWRALTSSLHSLILIAAPQLDADSELFAGALRNRHSVLRHVNSGSDRRSGSMDLERMRRFDLQQALERNGLGEGEAQRVAQAAGGNFTILRRVFARGAEVQFPEWSKDPVLATLLLAGAWEDERHGDCQIIEKLAKLPYDKAREVATKWRFEPDSPVRLVAKERGEGKIWEFLSPLDAWESLRRWLTSALIGTLAEVAVEVLSEDHPALLLPPEDRVFAAIKGKVPKFSHDLRQGITEVLAIGASREDESGMPKELSIARHAASVVRRVLSPNCSWHRWASLGQLLSSLAEAAPDEFLSIVERDLISSDPQTIELIRQEIPPDGLEGAAYHSGLLWALETTAWPPNHLARVAVILAQLIQLDPGGRWSNRPLGSAVSLFFSWRPQTVAPVGERIEVLKMLCREWPTAAWQILKALIPKVHDSFMDSSKPSYRDWAAGWTGETTDNEFLVFLDAVAECTLQLSRASPERWTELVGKIGALYLSSHTAYEKMRDAFETLVSEGLPTEIKETLWQNLRGFIQHHLNYSEAKWALSYGEIARWIILRDNLRPDDLVVQHAYLFGSDRGALDESLTYEQERDLRLVERRAAIRKIWLAGGATEITRLARHSEKPWVVGEALAEEIGEEAESSIIPASLACGDESLERLGKAFAGKRIFLRGAAWAENVPAIDWTDEQSAAWALQMPFGVRTWDWVMNRGKAIDCLYWGEIGSWGGGDLEEVEAKRAFQNYLRADRPWDALQFLMFRKEIKHAAEAEMFCEALEAVLLSQIKPDPEAMNLRHNLREALSFVQKAEIEIGEDRLAKLEFSFLQLLDESFLLPITLQRKLSREPHFFVDCLKVLYHPDSGQGKSEGDSVADDVEKLTEKNQTLAERIWSLLHNWRIIPGTDSEGIVVEKSLKSWIVESQLLATGANRRNICDIHIGQIFARSPADVDEGVPLVAIRNVIEECKSEQIERGFLSGLHNLRGIYSRSSNEGGKQEKKLADRFEGYAHISVRWPRTARVLRTVAKDYREQAQFEDERAQARE